MVAYNERILETSTSRQRRHRAERMLINLAPFVAQLERDAASRVASEMPGRATAAGGLPEAAGERNRDAAVRPVPRSADEEFEVVWSGKDDSLSNMTHVDATEEWTPDLEPRADELVGRRR